MDDFFERKVSSIISNVSLTEKPYLTHFLNLLEQDTINRILKRYKDVLVKYNGGFCNSEYQKGLIYVKEELDFDISILKLEYNPKYLILNHRKLLGIITSLGISRDRIGDINFEEGIAYIAVSKEVVNFLIENLSIVNNQSVNISEYSGFIEEKDTGKERTVFLKSNRIDALISSAFGLSRDESQKLIANDLVRINQKNVNKSFQSVKPYDIISISHKGRIKIDGDFNESRSGRIVIKVRIYR